MAGALPRMTQLLYLCHRIPYPPDKGDKIRSYHVLEALRSRYDVHLGTFVDSPEDWEHVEVLRGRVASLCVRPLPRRWATVRSMRGFLTGEALTLPFYRDAGLLRWVHGLASTGSIAGALVYSSAMAQYLDGVTLSVAVMDFCDIDSEKWAQYAKARSWPWSRIYAREARRLAEFEHRVAARFDANLFVSELESAVFRARHPQLSARIFTVGNGVDTGFFDPARAPPGGERGVHLVFTGAMDYWANVDAVQWFVKEVWPLVRDRHPHARFSIVGSKPAPDVLSLAAHPGVTVTGRVPDVRPWLAGATIVVAPLRIARGVQNKVLEAMSMARPVVATGAALQGLGELRLPDVIRADTPREFAAAIETTLNRNIGSAAANREFVEQRFAWTAALKPLWPLMERV